MKEKAKTRKILIIGSGPIVIGQAAEFDYSGSQACKALKEEGVFVILVNSNPATIQTDPTMADKIYIEPLNITTLTKIIEREKPNGLLGTMGGQTALNLTRELSAKGILKKFKVRVLGTNEKAIEVGENRESFKKLMKKINQPLPKSGIANSIESALKIAGKIGYPVIVRPAYCLGGTGSGVAYFEEELKRIAKTGLNLSIINQLLIEECVLGWAEIEYELVRDNKGNVIVVCPMENMDPMGIHTGDSVVVAPLLTLSKKEDKMLREASKKIVCALNIKGGCNVQLALNRKTKEYRIIEINPRLSRSSALASKATAYPIAKVAAKIALGKNLNEIEIGENRNAFFEPKPNYVVVKIPRWPFDKFLGTNKILGTQMKGVGEVMAIGGNFEEALLKAIRSLEIENQDLEDEKIEKLSDFEIKDLLKNATDKRIFAIAASLKKGFSLREIFDITKINRYFIKKIKNIIEAERLLKENKIKAEHAAKLGISIKKISKLTNKKEKQIKKKIQPVYIQVAPYAPYFFSTYSKRTPKTQTKSSNKKIIVLGSGPIRIGQGIEFDYCCCHAVSAIKEQGIEAIMINCNPETVSTDYDTSDKLYFEPITLEDIENIIEREKPTGIILQFGGQTPIKLAKSLKTKIKIFGTSEKSVAMAEDRDKFSKVLKNLNIKQAEFGIAINKEQARQIVKKVGYPVLIRPSFVLGGRAMEIIENNEQFEYYIEEAIRVSEHNPVLIDRFLKNALECEVDALSDGKDVYIPAIMEHIEKAGIHSGDSSCVTPPVILRQETKDKIFEISKKIALALKTIGLINIQFAVKAGKIYVLEANPRASRTIPFLSKALNLPLVKIATQIILGKKLKDFNLPDKEPNYYAVKSVTFPFNKLPKMDFSLSPEMKSTGEVMGRAPTFSLAHFKALSATGLPEIQNLFISLRDKDKQKLKRVTQELKELCRIYGIKLFSTLGTAKYLQKMGLEPVLVKKLEEEGKDAIELLKDKKIDLIINTFVKKKEYGDSFKIRRAAIDSNVYCLTTIEAAIALIKALEKYYKREINIYSLDDLD